MLSHIAIQGLGPHGALHLALSPNGVTHINGPSESGKSSLIDAIAVTLWGCDRTGGAFPVEAIADDAPRLMVELTTAKGTQLRRTMTRKRSMGRQRQNLGQERFDWKSEAKWQGSLGIIGNKALLLPILSPMVWREKVNREQGRPLRDWLASFLVDRSKQADVVKSRLSEDVVAPLPEHCFGLSESDALDARRQARRSRDHAAGALRQAKAALAQIAEVEAGAQEAYRAALADLGEPPPAQQVTLKASRASLRKAQTASARAESAWTAALAEFSRHEVPVPPVAPEVDDWVFADGAWSTLQDNGFSCRLELTPNDSIRVQSDDASLDLPFFAVAHLLSLVDFDEAGAAAEAVENKRLEAAKDKAGHAAQVARKVREQAQAALDKAEAEAEAIAAYQKRKAAIQPPPSAAARTKLEAQVSEAETAFAQKERAAKAWDQVVTAVREAPGIMLHQGLLGLNGLLQPDGVQVMAGPQGCTVQIDGRDYTLASRGRLIRADLALRLALRRVLKCGWFPVLVDDANAWSGDWPESPGGPTVYLWTRAQEEITSSATGRGAA